MGSKVVWDVPPSKLAGRIKDYGQQQLAGLMALADYHATAGQNEMRDGASWTDRTANARGGLMGVAVREGDKVVIYFVHSVFYGKFLELKNAGRFAIVWPTTVRKAQEIMRDVKRAYR